MTNDYLREADKTACKYLEDLFSLSISPHEVYDVHDPESNDRISEIESQLNCSLDHKKIKSDSISLFSSDGEKGGSYIIIMLNSEPNAYLFYLGDNITSCEHMFAHRGVDDMREYDRKFHRAYIAMIGTLGTHSIHENLYGQDERPGMSVSKPGKGSILSTPNFIGSQFAMQLVGSGQEIPYKDLFWAPSTEEGMRIFCEIARPTVALVDYDIPKRTKAEILGAFVELGLDTNVLDWPQVDLDDLMNMF